MPVLIATFLVRLYLRCLIWNLTIHIYFDDVFSRVATQLKLLGSVDLTEMNREVHKCRRLRKRMKPVKESGIESHCQDM